MEKKRHSVRPAQWTVCPTCGEWSERIHLLSVPGLGRVYRIASTMVALVWLSPKLRVREKCMTLVNEVFRF